MPQKFQTDQASLFSSTAAPTSSSNVKKNAYPIKAFLFPEAVTPSLDQKKSPQGKDRVRRQIFGTATVPKRSLQKISSQMMLQYIKLKNTTSEGDY